MPSRTSLYALGVLFAATGMAFGAGLQRSGGTGGAGVSQPWGGAQDAVNYKLPNEDGTAEDSIGLGGTGTHDLIWLNRFTVAAGGEVITSVQAAFGTPAFPAPQYVGRPLTVALYEDADGGSTLNAVLKTTLNTTIPGQGDNVLYNFDIADTAVTGTFLVAMITKNAPNNDAYHAAWDNTAPHDANSSFIGFTAPGNTLNQANLGSIPAGQYGTIEGFGLPGNWLIRAIGEPIPEPASLSLLALGAAALLRRRA
jgi:hypothetical protein